MAMMRLFVDPAARVEYNNLSCDERTRLPGLDIPCPSLMVSASTIGHLQFGAGEGLVACSEAGFFLFVSNPAKKPYVLRIAARPREDGYIVPVVTGIGYALLGQGRDDKAFLVFQDFEVLEHLDGTIAPREDAASLSASAFFHFERALNPHLRDPFLVQPEYVVHDPQLRYLDRPETLSRLLRAAIVAHRDDADVVASVRGVLAYIWGMPAGEAARIIATRGVSARGRAICTRILEIVDPRGWALDPSAASLQGHAPLMTRITQGVRVPHRETIEPAPERRDPTALERAAAHEEMCEILDYWRIPAEDVIGIGDKP